jgi:hypothetical protein
VGPCNWNLNPTCPDFTTATATQQQAALDLATWLLWAWSGRVFGVCETTVRPCFQPPNRATTYRGHDTGAGMAYWPGLIAGQWTSGPCGCGSPSCICTSRAEVPLPGPVYSITEVRIDGVIVDPDGYRVKNNRWLRRVDGNDWPQTQDLNADDDEAGAFVVTYLKGIPLSDAGRVAAEAYVCELVRGMAGQVCGIPERAVSVARQGIDIQLLDEAQFVTEGLTGVPLVDRWILSVNPNRVTAPPRLYNPDAIAATARIRSGW